MNEQNPVLAAAFDALVRENELLKADLLYKRGLIDQLMEELHELRSKGK